MKTSQALVTVGGRGKRLKDDVSVPLSKSFIRMGERPIFYHCVQTLHAAGISKLVVVAEEAIKLEYAQNVIKEAGGVFREVKFYQDPGLGTYGLPWQARELLDDVFFFECGHNITNPTFFTALDEAKTPSTVVFSGHTPEADNERTVFNIQGSPFVIGHPQLLDRQYVEDLPSLHFNINEIFPFYLKKNRLTVLPNSSPVEFDIKNEYERSLRHYEKLTGQGNI